MLEQPLRQSAGNIQPDEVGMAGIALAHQRRQRPEQALHDSGLAARILAKHSGLTVFQFKTILYALATNASSDPHPLV